MLRGPVKPSRTSRPALTTRTLMASPEVVVMATDSPSRRDKTNIGDSFLKNAAGLHPCTGIVPTGGGILFAVEHSFDVFAVLASPATCRKCKTAFFQFFPSRLAG